MIKMGCFMDYLRKCSKIQILVIETNTMMPQQLITFFFLFLSPHFHLKLTTMNNLWDKQGLSAVVSLDAASGLKVMK